MEYVKYLWIWILLNILVNKKMAGAKIFARIFQNSSSKSILKFLDNESDLLEDLEIIYDPTSGHFIQHDNPTLVNEKLLEFFGK